MYLGFRGNDPDMANLQKVYAVFRNSGDIDAEFYSEPDEAAESARDDWERLTLDEKRRNHIYSALIRRKDLDFREMDDDDLENGIVDWWCFTGTDTYPGAFDSEQPYSEERIKEVLELGWEYCYEFLEDENKHAYRVALDDDGNCVTWIVPLSFYLNTFSVEYLDGVYPDNGFEKACKELTEMVNAYLRPKVR